MRKAIPVFVLIALMLALVGLVLLGQPASAQEGSPTPTPQPDLQQPESSGGSQAGDIRSNALTSMVFSNPYCYQPDPTVNKCFINIRYYQASDDGVSAPYMLGVNISINGKLRARENLFFENNIYYSYDMIPNGLQVTCGSPNSGGAGAAYGAVYSVNVEPMDTTGVSMGYDHASLACPAYAP
jgi:hypothetical protein